MKRIIIGDPHGNYLGIESILSKASYSSNEDILGFTGDYGDFFLNKKLSTKKTIDLILSLKKNANVFAVMGNHDKWFRDWIIAKVSFPIPLWYLQGGRETLQSYNEHENIYFLSKPFIDYKDLIPKEHIDFYLNLKPYYVDNKVVVVHGGFANYLDMEYVAQDSFTPNNIYLHEEIMWDRDFYRTSGRLDYWKKYKKYFGDRICIMGHTPKGPMVDDFRVLIDGGSGGGGSLYGAIIEEDKEVKIIKE